MKLGLNGKTAVITGGARGIGAATGIALAKSGVNVVINYLPSERDIAGFESVQAEIQSFGGNCRGIPGDITDTEFCSSLCRSAVDSWGSLDIVVNSAGFAIPAGCSETTDEMWRNGIEVNLSAAFYIARAAVGFMMDSGGRIIFIGSAGSITGGGGSAFYSAAKAGINGLVRNLSKEIAPKGITVNAVLPALIETDLLKDRYADQDRRRELTARIPVGFLGQPEDVANLVLFLASDEARFICGQNIIIDGGSTYK